MKGKWLRIFGEFRPTNHTAVAAIASTHKSEVERSWTAFFIGPSDFEILPGNVGRDYLAPLYALSFFCG